MSRLEDDVQAKASWFGRRSVGQLVALFIGTVLLLTVVGGVISFASSWFHTGTAIISPTNVKTQWFQGYQDMESLKALAANTCQAEKLAVTETDPFIKSQREDEVLAYSTNYNRVAAEYDRAYENLFEGKIVKPADLPRRAPTLAAMKLQVC